MSCSRDKKLVLLSILLLLLIFPLSKKSSFPSEKSTLNATTAENTKILFLPSNQTDYTLNEISQFDTGYGYPVDVEVVDNLAFTVSSRGGLFIFNVSEPTQPVLIGSYDEPKNITENNYWSTYGGLAAGLAFKDNLIFLGDGLNGLVVLNVSDPTNPQKIGHCKDRPIPDVIVEGNYAFGRLLSSGIPIINISDPFNPVFITEIDDDVFSPGDVRDFYVEETILFVLSIDLVIIDISNPYHPVEISRMSEYGGFALSLTSDDLLYIVSSDVFSHDPNPNNLTIFNVTDPFIPQLISENIIVGIDDYVNGMYVDNFTIYISTIAAELNVLHLDNDSSVTFISSLPLSGVIGKFEIKSITYENDTISKRVYCANWNKGFQILDCINSSNLILLSEYDFGGQTKAVYVDGEYIYLLTEHDWPVNPTTLIILQQTGGENPELVGNYTFNEQYIRDVVVHEHFAFLAGSGLTILDLNDPSNPTVIGQYSEGFSSTRAICYDPHRELVFLGDYYRGYGILNVTDKTNPVLLSQGNPWDMSVSNIFLEGNLLFLADQKPYGSFGIIDTTTPIAPTYLHREEVNEAVFSLYAVDNLLYLSTDYTALIIYDISNLENPQLIGQLRTGWWFDGLELVVEDDLAYIAREANGLMIIDVHLPRKPQLLMTFRDHYAGLSYDVTVSDGTIYLADGWDGLEILELIPPAINEKLLSIIAILTPTIGLVIVTIIIVIQYKKKEV